MAPDVKIRNLNEATFERLRTRAAAEGSSMESLLRAIVADGVDGDAPNLKGLVLMLLERIVRLEYRLEQSEIFKDGELYRDAELRFALEHDLPLPTRERSPISNEFVERVDKWLEENEDNPDATFVKLAHDFSEDGGIGKEVWPELFTVLEYFSLRGRWHSAIARVCSDPHPAYLKKIQRHPYKDT